MSQIMNYHKQRKNTVLLVSHSMEDIARIADRVLVMNDAQVSMMEPTHAVFARGRELQEMGLRVPQITEIMQRLQEKGFPVASGVLTVEQGLRELMKLMGKEEGNRG